MCLGKSKGWSEAGKRDRVETSGIPVSHTGELGLLFMWWGRAGTSQNSSQQKQHSGMCVSQRLLNRNGEDAMFLLVSQPPRESLFPHSFRKTSLKGLKGLGTGPITSLTGGHSYSALCLFFQLFELSWYKNTALICEETRRESIPEQSRYGHNPGTLIQFAPNTIFQK